MTPLHVICGLPPPNQKSWLRLCKWPPKCKGVRKGGVLGVQTPPIGLSTKMLNKENITFLALLSLFFCNDMDSNMI